jgi:hypothetical protein
MAIQPIDLQTLFVRLSQVGREQSAIRDAVAQNQLVTGNEIAQKSQETESAVTQSSEIPEGPEVVDEDGSGGQHPESERRRRESGEHEDEDVFHDPDLGQNVDLTG